jgi:glucose/mannose-6-phosphate isomerase
MTTEPVPALDDVVRMQAVDKRNMLRLITELPEQCETAFGVARSFPIEPRETRPTDVFITGVGDSGIAADMAAAVLSEESEIPIVSDHGGRLPKHVGENSLVFVVDYTGKSSSELRSMRDAKHRGAEVICVSSGGKLLEAAAKDEIKRIKIPPGQPQRSAIGYLFVPLVVTIERLGLSEGQIEKLSHGIKLLKNVREALRFENPSSRNVAKQTAQSLFGKLVVVYGALGYRGAIAGRWTSQINANSKGLAFSGVLQDLALGHISGWELMTDRADEFGIVLLRDPSDKGEIAELMAASEEVLQPFNVVRADIRGATTMEKLLYGVYLGDYVSYYLALLNEVNPFVTENVSTIEAKMAGEPEVQAPAAATIIDEQAEA